MYKGDYNALRDYGHAIRLEPKEARHCRYRAKLFDKMEKPGRAARDRKKMAELERRSKKR